MGRVRFASGSIASRRMLRLWVAFLLLPCCGGGQNASTPVISTTSSEVLVDFVVRDKGGHIVRNLRPEEVRVFENDVPQQIRGFAFFDKGAPAEPQTQPQPAAEPSPMAGNAHKWQELRNTNVVTAVFAGPFDPQSDAGVLARDLMRDILTQEMHADTLVGVFTLDRGQLGAVLPYTNDAAEVGPALVTAVESLTGRKVSGSVSAPSQGPAGAPRATLSPAVRAAVDRVIMRLLRPPMIEDEKGLMSPMRVESTYQSESQLLALLHLMQAQAEFAGRKLVLYVGHGLSIDAQFKELLRAVVGAANRTGVTLCGVDLNPMSRSELAGPRQLLDRAVQASQAERMAKSDEPVTRERVLAMETAEQSLVADTTMNLENLSKETGGEFIRGNDLRTPLRRELEDARSHWELTYTPADVREDGRFRSLRVAVSRPGVTVTARSGYYALPMLNGEQIALFEYAPFVALNAQPAPREFEFHAAALRFRPGAMVQHEMVFEAPLREAALVKDPGAKAKGVTAHLSFLALLKDADGRVVTRVSRDLSYRAPDEPGLRSQVATHAAPFAAPPGRYTLESAVVDRNSGKASTRRAALVVASGAGLALSDLSLVQRLEPASGAPDERDPLAIRTGRVIPEVAGTVHAGNDLGFYAMVYPDARSAAPLAVVLELLHEGQRVASREYGPIDSARGAQPVLASFPSRDLKAGQYEARLTVRQGELSRQQVLPVTLAR